MSRPLSVALAQYAPVADTDPVAALPGQAAEIVAQTTALDPLADANAGRTDAALHIEPTRWQPRGRA